jgi:hypothetical protein
MDIYRTRACWCRSKAVTNFVMYNFCTRQALKPTAGPPKLAAKAADALAQHAAHFANHVGGQVLHIGHNVSVLAQRFANRHLWLSALTVVVDTRLGVAPNGKIRISRIFKLCVKV